MEQAKFEIGMAVMISRSDGRTHAATVKSVDELKAAVNVEWQEDGAYKGKEIAISDLWVINAHLFQQPETPKPPVQVPAEQPPAQKKYEGRLRSSRMLPPSDTAPQAGPSEEPVSKRFTSNFSRAACRQSTVVDPAVSSDGVAQDMPPSAIPRPSALPTYPKRTKPKHTAQLPLVEAMCESEESRCAPPSTAARRMSVSQNGSAAGSKRLSIMPKASDTQTKKVKPAEASRTNKPFHQMIEEYRETVEKVPMSHSGRVQNPRICVCVRKRPLSKKERGRKEVDVVTIPGNGTLLFHEPKQKVDLTKYLENQVFHFDHSFDEEVTNETVYRYTAKPLVHSIFEGGMATCFAYGQTGSGKTHTMGGDFSGKNQNSSKGIYALAAQDVFSLLRQYPDIDPFVSFFEIYNGKVFDLLNKKAQLRVLEDEWQQVQVVGLQEMSVTCVGDVIKMIERGSACRTSGQTFANANSSRSHAVLQIILRRNLQLHGKFSLVDLAGNERGMDVRSNDRQTLAETAEINRSLLALKECIRSLGHNSDHIPFRMSKLTQVLRDSFIGENSRTCMIAMISPGMGSCDYTLNTLRYANRVKELNGTSKAVQDAANKGEMSASCSSSDDSIVPLYDVMSQVAEMEEKLREEILAGRDFYASMVSPSFDALASLPEIKDFFQRSLDAVKALEEAIKAEEELTSFTT
ncbi:kinesin-like protein KIF2C isoform X1 [Alosa alosa]|uniref:kinesin-like protein KIF2C isoform X1 n=1 Tax=Alosa alosa TaxID=278164 RepID=UPI0020154296|nr:kinesin-like protein KIF2C isoform X1 [Alosa alosa]